MIDPSHPGDLMTVCGVMTVYAIPGASGDVDIRKLEMQPAKRLHISLVAS